MIKISALGKKGLSRPVRNVNFNKKIMLHEEQKTNPVLENIISEGGDDFFQYLNWTGLAGDPNLMVLSSLQHYYYDHNDLKGIRSLINLKSLNHIKHLESFLHTLYRLLPSDSYFVGCFKSCHQHRRRSPFSHPPEFLTGIINFLDKKADRRLSKNAVKGLLEENGFKVIDMTDINGMTFFWSQNGKRKWE